MLVITRREGEEIVIVKPGQRTGIFGRVRVSRIQGRAGADTGRVRIALNFPTDVSVHRGEVYDEILAEQGRPPSAQGGA